MLDSGPVALTVPRTSALHGLLVAVTLVLGGLLTVTTLVAIALVASPAAMPSRVEHAARTIVDALPDGAGSAVAVLIVGAGVLVALVAACAATSGPRAMRAAVATPARPAGDVRSAMPAGPAGDRPRPTHPRTARPAPRAARTRARRAHPVGAALGILAALAVVAIVAVIALRAVPVGAHDADPALSPAVQAEVDYVQAHWSDRNTAEYGSLGGNDCANFASQALVARGWTPDATWWHHGAGSAQTYSTAWIGSTSMARWLGEHPDWALPLDDSQRADVAVGDLVQFDWDDSGNRDHTGIVTSVERTGDRVRILYASHSNDRHDFSVDEALALDGGSAYYWHLTR